MVEQLPLKELVGGSNPSGLTSRIFKVARSTSYDFINLKKLLKLDLIRSNLKIKDTDKNLRHLYYRR